MGQDHFLAPWGVSFSNPAREGGGVYASEWALNKTSELRRHGLPFIAGAAGLVKETPRCQEEPGQGQADPLEGLFACTETPGVNSENAERNILVCGSGGGGGGRETFLSSQHPKLVGWMARLLLSRAASHQVRTNLDSFRLHLPCCL